jgi:flagellar motor component MotA
MTGKADFSDQEWTQVLEGPTSAGMLVIASDRGGSVRESFSMAKAYTDARREHGDSELLDTIVATKPEVDRTRAHSQEELEEHSLQNIRDAVALVEQKATPEELADYKKFIANLAKSVAEARKEGFLGLSGERVSDDERAAIERISEALR